MKITDTIDGGSDADLLVEWTVRKNHTSDKGSRPVEVWIEVRVDRDDMGNWDGVLFSSTVRSATIKEGADAALAELEKWMSTTARIHEHAVRMRRMLEREEGGK